MLNLGLLMFVCVCLILLAGYPVAFTLSGTAILFAILGHFTGHFDQALLTALPNRLFGIISNQTLIAVPLFIFMGIMLEKARIAEELLENMSRLMGRWRGGIGISVIIVGTLLAASTGIIGATVVTMGILSLPTMLKKGYPESIATGTICATGTLGQIIPPSIALILLGDVLSSSYQQAQLQLGNFNPETVSVGNLFVGALLPGLLLVLLYLIYQCYITRNLPGYQTEPKQLAKLSIWTVCKTLLAPLALIIIVLGSIIAGIATTTEAAAVGAVGAVTLALIKRQLSYSKLLQVAQQTAKITCMVFGILFGAALFSLVFRGFEGDHAIQSTLGQIPGGIYSATFIVMVTIFILGFILDFIEITFVVIPIVSIPLFLQGLDPIWLGIMIAINLQTSFLTPPFGFALFYLRSVTPENITTQTIYKGVIPYILIQLLLMAILCIWPTLATWLPKQIYS